MKAAAKPRADDDDDDDDNDDDAGDNDDDEAVAVAAAAAEGGERVKADRRGAAGRDVAPSLAARHAPPSVSEPVRTHLKPHPAPSPLSSSASTTAAAAAAATGKRKAVKDKDRPKRALSMFNFFFREEREKLMAERIAGRGALAEAEQRGIAEGKDANTRKKELFALVGKLIAERWKRVTPQELERLKGLADQDMVRFNDEMSQYQINVARKKRVKDESSASPGGSAAAPAAVASAGGRTFPMYPGEPALNLYRPVGSPLASFAAASALQRPGLSVDDQLQRDPSLRLPTPIEDLLRARRRAVLGEFNPTSPNTAPSHFPQPRHHGLQPSDPATASPGSAGLLSSGSFRRIGEGISAESMMPPSARPYVPALDASSGGGGPAYETQQQLLMQLLQQDRTRLFAGSSTIDQLSSLGIGRNVGGGYPLGSFQTQQHQALHQQQQQHQQHQQHQQQVPLWPEAQSSRMATSSDVLRSELQRQERDMVALLRQQQQLGATSATGLASLSEASLQQKLSYHELLQMQQHQQQQQQLLQLQRLQQHQLEQQQQQQEQLHQFLRRARRDSDSEGEPDPYP